MTSPVSHPQQSSGNNYRAFRYYSYLFKKHENPLVKQGVFCFLLFLTIHSSPLLETVSEFLSEEGNAYGRPVGVALDKQGALLVADDVGNVVWRVSAGRQAQAWQAVHELIAFHRGM